MYKKVSVVLGALALMVAIGSGTSQLYAGESGRVYICHVPPGNPANARTITVAVDAVAAHLAHGDLLNVCPG